MYYTIKPYKDHYIVSAFDGTQQPIHQYEVWLHKPHCTCPGYRKTPGISHKHVAMVSMWKNSGSPGFVAIEFIDNQPTIIHTQYEIT